jgi:hypothetical protein
MCNKKRKSSFKTQPLGTDGSRHYKLKKTTTVIYTDSFDHRKPYKRIETLELITDDPSIVKLFGSTKC